MSHAIASILVPFDFSAQSSAALGWASRLRRQLGAVAVHVIHVWNLLPAAMAGAPPGSAPTADDLAGIERELRNACRAEGLEASVSVELVSDVAEAILRKAEAQGSDLIIMGTHGRGGLSRSVLGSVADRVVRHASCPVTVIRTGRS